VAHKEASRVVSKVIKVVKVVNKVVNKVARVGNKVVKVVNKVVRLASKVVNKVVRVVNKVVRAVSKAVKAVSKVVSRVAVVEDDEASLIAHVALLAATPMPAGGDLIRMTNRPGSTLFNRLLNIAVSTTHCIHIHILLSVTHYRHHQKHSSRFTSFRAFCSHVRIRRNDIIEDCQG
jgi:hypothetical protein